LKKREKTGVVNKVNLGLKAALGVDIMGYDYREKELREARENV